MGPEFVLSCAQILPGIITWHSSRRLTARPKNACFEKIFAVQSLANIAAQQSLCTDQCRKEAFSETIFGAFLGIASIAGLLTIAA